MIVIKPYVKAGPLVFGSSMPDDCWLSFGEPRVKEVTKSARQRYYYEDLIVDFESDGLFRGMSLLPYCQAALEDIPVTWDREFLRRACAKDGSPFESNGFIVLQRLGVCITGIHDDDRGQLCIGAFCKGGFPLRDNARPFVWE